VLCLHFVAWCYVLVLCVAIIFVAILLTHSNIFLFFSFIVVLTLSFFAFTPYPDVTCVVPFLFCNCYYIVIFVFSPYFVVISMNTYVSCFTFAL
jgi:hypothetical protein